MLALILAAAVAGIPSPQPTPPLKIIVNVRSDSFCSTIRDTAIPIAYVATRNEQAFADMNHSMLKIAQNLQGVTSATKSELRSMGNELDDLEIYSPSSELSAIQLNKIAYEIAQNLVLEDRVMSTSWKRYPKGQFPN